MTFLNVVPDGVEQCFSCPVFHGFDKDFASFATNSAEDPLLRKDSATVILPSCEHAFVNFNRQPGASDFLLGPLFQPHNACIAHVIVPIDDGVFVHLKLTRAPLNGTLLARPKVEKPNGGNERNARVLEECSDTQANFAFALVAHAHPCQ